MHGLHVEARIFHYKKEVPTSANHVSRRLGHASCREPVPLQNDNPASDKSNIFGAQSYRIVPNGLPRITRTNPSQAMCVPHSYKVHLHKMSWPLIYLQKASPFQLPWWGRAPHFVATSCWCTAKVLQNAIPRRHVYYKMTDTAAQKKIQVYVENYVSFFDPFCSNTYSHVFKFHDAKKKGVFFIFCGKLLGNPFGSEFSPLKKWKAGSVQCACVAGL